MKTQGKVYDESNKKYDYYYNDQLLSMVSEEPSKITQNFTHTNLFIHNNTQQSSLFILLKNKL